MDGNISFSRLCVAVGRSVKRAFPLVCFGLVALACGLARADEPPPLVLPDLGLNETVGSYVSLVITAIGGFILTVLGGFFALKGFQVGMKWISKLLGV